MWSIIHRTKFLVNFQETETQEESAPDPVEEDVVVETSNPEKVSSSDLLDDYDVRVVNGSMHDACVL